MAAMARRVEMRPKDKARVSLVETEMRMLMQNLRTRRYSLHIVFNSAGDLISWLLLKECEGWLH